MKQFTRRRNSQKQRGSEYHGTAKPLPHVEFGSQEPHGSALFASPEDPYSFPDNPEVEQPRTTQQGELHWAKVRVPWEAVEAVQVSRSTSTEYSAHHKALNRKPSADASTPAATGSPTKRAKVQAVNGSEQKACATAGTVSGSKRIATPASPPQATAKPTATSRGASALAGAGVCTQDPGRDKGAQCSNSTARTQLGRAASGGAGSGRSASGGAHKRTKSHSPPLIDLSASSGNPAAAAAAAGGCKPTSSQQQQQPPTTPVSLPTPRRPAKLIPAGLIAAAAVEARPAQTVMEAQERGELVQMQDDARYAMDGLAPTCSIETQRESAVALTEMLCSRKGRLALRSDGLAQQVLSSLAKVKPFKDSVLSLASTIVLLMLTAEDAHPAYLASVAAAVLFDQLLQNNHTFEAAADSCTQGGKLVRMLKSRPVSGLLASTGVTGQRELLLVTLEQATSSQQASKVAAVERLKHNLRQYGALTRLGRLVAEAAEDVASAARQLRPLLLVLENATFTCQANGQTLVQLQVAAPRSGISSSSQEDQQQAFPVLLVQVANQLMSAGDQEDCQQALHVCLSVLMNLSHQNPGGAVGIAAAGGMQAGSAVIGQLLGPARHSRQELCKQVLQHLELVSVALGLLINLVSGEPANSRQLASMQAESSSRQGAAADDSCSLVSLLCSVMTAVGELLQQAADDEGMSDAAAARAPSRRTSSAAGSGLEDDNSAGEASIVEAYCAMLLGFLVRDCQDVAQCVPKMLEGQSLQPIVEAVQRCLNFYISTGAITEHTRNTLEELLQQLSRCG